MVRLRELALVSEPAKSGASVDCCMYVSAASVLTQQDGGLDTVEANRQLGFKDDERTYECVDFILRDMGIKVSPRIASTASIFRSHLAWCFFFSRVLTILDGLQRLRERESTSTTKARESEFPEIARSESYRKPPPRIRCVFVYSCRRSCPPFFVLTLLFIFFTALSRTEPKTCTFQPTNSAHFF